MTRSRVLALLFSLCLGIGLVPSVSEATPPAAQQLAGPGYHEPAVGLCYDLTTRQANKASVTQDAVPCDAPHTLMTIKVKRLSKPVRWTAVYSRIVVSCYEALYDVLGSAKLAEMSSYDLWWFIPTKDERAQGARWARCDVGLHKGTSGLGKLPTSVALGGLPLDDKYARCLVGKALNDTSCQMSHKFRAKAAYKLDRRASSREEYLKQGRRCARLTNSNRYAFDGPSDEEWRAGNHFMVCFKPD